MRHFRRLLWPKHSYPCQHCQDLYDGTLQLPAKEVIQGSMAGCPSCQLLYYSISPSDRDDPRIDLVYVRFSSSAIIHTFDPRTVDMSLRLRSQDGFNKGGWFASPGYTTALYPPVERVVELYSLQGDISPWPSIKASRHVAAVADDPDCLDLVRSWLSDCRRNHRECNKESSTLLPDRVIFVGAGSGPHLVETPPGTRGEYLALSHCWGGKVSLILEKETLAEFKRGIPFSRFPKTFQDAITVCRALAVDYIWIDSLCIIQNSKEDWDIQGAKMDQVYTNCLLTLAADAAENGDAGFLRGPERHDLHQKTRRLVCHGPAHEEIEVFVRPYRKFGSSGGFGRHYDSREFVDPLKPPETRGQGSHLVGRGWVLQETFLPRRMVHFLPHEVSWRCVSSSRCECMLQPHDKDRIVHEPLDQEQPREIKIADLKEYWKEIVEQYTQRKLTFSKDRLVALGGLAALAQGASPRVQYYAGLWADALPSTLLWIVYHPVELAERSSERIQPFIAPTWSWASVTGCVMFLFWKRSYGRGSWASSPPDLTNIQIHCVPSGPNKYGNLESGARLTADGYLCNVQLQLADASKWHFPCKMESRKPGATNTHSARGFLYADTYEFLASLRVKSDEGISTVVVSVYESRIFLVLRQVGEGHLLVFERVGVVYCEKYFDLEEGRSMGALIRLPEWGHKQRFSII